MAAKKNRAHLDADAVARMMAAQDREDEPAVADPEPKAPTPQPETMPVVARSVAPPAPAFDPGKVDGRTLRKTGREPFATRIKPETHEALRRIAYAKRISIAEAVEQAVASFEKMQS